MILKASCYWLDNLTIECCGQFQPHFQRIHEKYLVVSEILKNQLQLPYIYVDQQTFENGNLLSRHKFAALKLDESIQVIFCYFFVIKLIK